MFSSITNSILTILSILFLIWLIPSMVQWAFIDGVWSGASLKECRAAANVPALQAMAQALGISASLQVNDDHILVRTEGPVNAERLELLLSHPLESDRDFTVVLVQSLPGEYRGRLTAPVAERWQWALIDEGEQPWRLDGCITAADLSSGDGG